MPKTDTPIETIAWLSPAQTGLVREVAEEAGLKLIGAGSPQRGASGGVAADLGAPTVDDLRHAIASASNIAILIADPGEFGIKEGIADREAVLDAQSRGVQIATLEPIPASALDLTAAGWVGTSPRAVDAISFVPLARQSTGYRAASELIEEFGLVRSMSVEVFCDRSHGTLGARLFSAMELVHTVMGDPDKIFCTSVSPAHKQGYSFNSETLRGLHGDLAATMRFGDGRAASIVASDHASGWSRRITLLGDEGRLYLNDDGFVWTASDGSINDRAHISENPTPVNPNAAVRVIGDGLSRALRKETRSFAPLDHGQVLALGQTALLSARTGQPESPLTLMNMAGTD